VLPFNNLSGDPEQEYFADGITEDLITGLQAIGIFPVIARTSTFSYKGQATDIRNIADALGAGYVLEGSVRRNEDQVRITAQLIDASGRHIWAENYDGELSKIFEVQDEITHQILGAIEPELLQVEMDRSRLVRTEDMEAWDYYLQASADATTFSGHADRYGRPITIERTRRALELAEKAVQLDPTFASAYTLLGHLNASYALALRAEVTDEFANRKMDEAIEYARRGRELSPFSASACSCYVALLAWVGREDALDPDGAVRIQEDAVRENPSSAISRAVLAKVYQILGRYEEGLEEIGIAKRLSPRDVDLSFFITVEAAINLALGEWESASASAHTAIQLVPLNYDAHAIRILSLYVLGEREQAVSAMETMVDSVPDFRVDSLWNDPLPTSLIPGVSPLVTSLEDTRYRQAVAAILGDLGWAPQL
jgi:adenylate cyclase